MTLRVPEVVRQAWGDEVIVEFVPWLEQTIEEKAAVQVEQAIADRAVPRDEYRQLLSRLEILEHDVADLKVDVRDLRSEMNGRFIDLERHFEMRFDQVNARFDQMNRHFETRLDEMNQRFGARFDEMNQRFGARFDEMNQRFEARFDQMNRHFETRFDEMNQRFEARFDEMNRHFETRLDQMNERMLVQTRWLIGTIALFGTIITVLMAIAQFTP